MRESAATSAETTTAKVEKPAAPETDGGVAATVVVPNAFAKVSASVLQLEARPGC